MPSTDRPGLGAHSEPAVRHRFRLPTIADLGRAGAALEVPEPSNCTPCTPISVASRSATLARPIEITTRLRRSAGEKVAPATPEGRRGQSQRPQLRSGPAGKGGTSQPGTYLKAGKCGNPVRVSGKDVPQHVLRQLQCLLNGSKPEHTDRPVGVEDLVHRRRRLVRASASSSTVPWSATSSRTRRPMSLRLLISLSHAITSSSLTCSAPCCMARCALVSRDTWMDPKCLACLVRPQRIG